MTSPAPLLVTRDEVLLDDVLRLAAAAGATLDVAHDTTAALRGWPTASVVLVGEDLVCAVAEQRPGHRADVHVLVRGAAVDAVFRAALLAGAADVVELPRAEDWLVEVLSDAADGAGAADRAARLVGVLAGSGGAGATTFACALGLVGAADGPAVLVDLDPLGPGVDRVVGLDTAGGPSDGTRWDDLVGSRGRLGSRSLRAALPRRDELAVLTWPPGPPVRLEADTVREVLGAARRGHHLVVADLPRHLGDIGTEVVARCDLVLLVAEPSVAGVVSAGRVAAQVLEVTDAVALVVRGNGIPIPADHVATILDLPLVAELPDQRRLAEHLDLGLGPVHSRRSPLARAARSVLASTQASAQTHRRSVA